MIFKNKIFLGIIGIIIISISIFLLFFNNAAPNANQIDSQNIIVIDNINIKPGEDIDMGGKIVDEIKEPPITDPLDKKILEEKTEQFIKVYYSFNKNNYQNYYSSMRKYVVQDSYNNLLLGEPTPTFMIREEDMNDTKNWFQVKLESFDKIEIPVESNRNKNAVVGVKVKYTIPAFDISPEEAASIGNVFHIEEKIWLEFNEDYLIHSISIESL